MPATKALMEAIDAKLLSLRADVVQEVGHGAGLEPWSDPRSLIDARTVLSKPRSRRPIATRSSVRQRPASGSRTSSSSAPTSAATRTACARRTIGRKFGFDTYESQNVGEPASSPGTGDPTTEENVAFHRSAFALVARTLALPKGKGPDQAAVFGDEGFGVRVVFDYDINKKQDVVLLRRALSARRRWTRTARS
jgi:hypothetical protein